MERIGAAGVTIRSMERITTGHIKTGTTGVTSHARFAPWSELVTKVRFELHELGIGGTFAPWSELGEIDVYRSYWKFAPWSECATKVVSVVRELGIDGKFAPRSELKQIDVYRWRITTGHQRKPQGDTQTHILRDSTTHHSTSQYVHRHKVSGMARLLSSPPL